MGIVGKATVGVGNVDARGERTSAEREWPQPEAVWLLAVSSARTLSSSTSDLWFGLFFHLNHHRTVNNGNSRPMHPTLSSLFKVACRFVAAESVHFATSPPRALLR